MIATGLRWLLSALTWALLFGAAGLSLAYAELAETSALGEASLLAPCGLLIAAAAFGLLARRSGR